MPKKSHGAVRFIAVLYLFVACAALAQGAGPLDLPLRAGDLDPAGSGCRKNGAVQPIEAERLAAILGLQPGGQDWTAGQVEENETPARFEYRFAFRRPIAVGSIFVHGTPDECWLLKPEGDPNAAVADAKSWQRITFPTRQAGGRLGTVLPGAATRAVVLAERRAGGRSAVRGVRLFSPRLHNVVPLGMAYADREYQVPNSSLVYEARRLVEGSGGWQSAGKDGTGRIPSPPISDVAPSWFVLAWAQPQTLAGCWLDDNFTQLEIDYYVGPEGLNPRVGGDAEWRKLREFRQQPHAGRWIDFAPLTTRGLRFRILKTKSQEAQFAALEGLHAWIDLGDAPPPDPAATQTPPPLRFDVQPPRGGSLTLVIDGPDGRRARNLLARVTQAGEPFSQGWDLKDEQGQFVSPGTYRWKALAHPPLTLRYETTVYPNTRAHAPGNSPWLNGHHGSGGWLADHTPPVAACAAGDRVYLGAPVAESGVSLIECDLDGKKRWGHHSFAAWTGPRFLASDGRSVFVAATILNTSTDAIWAVDTESKEVRPFLSLLPTAQRRRGLQGLAAKAGEVALSVQGPQDWFAGAATEEDADPENCVPAYAPKRKPRVAYEVVPDRRGDFLKLFRLYGYPPGGETGSSLTYLQPIEDSRGRQHVVLAFRREVPLGSVAFPVPADKQTKLRLSALKPGAVYPPHVEREADWQPFTRHGERAWDVVPAPPGTRTRALRITFSRGEDGSEPDLLAELEGKKPLAPEPLDIEAVGAKPKDPTKLAPLGKEKWEAQLEGMKLLRRRYESRLPQARVRFNSGRLLPDGTWDAERSRPLSADDPGIYLLEWDEPQALRGLAIREIDGQRTKIDVFTGAGPVPLEGAAGWEEVAQYEQQRRDVGNGYGLGVMNPQARYVDGYVDFGREIRTRAVRLRVIEQWSDKGQAGCMGIRIDLGGGNLDARRCRVFGVAPVAYLGGEAPLDAAADERVELYDAEGKLRREFPLPRPRELAYDTQGALWAISGAEVVRLVNDAPQRVVTDLKAPTDLAFDAAGGLYVFDNDPERKQIRVYDPQGQFQRSLGKPGGFRAGPWDPERLGDVTALAIDARGQVWAVENQYWPKRVTVWKADGTFVRELLGNTSYGGGGVLDPEDKSRLFYGPLEFEIDWKTGDSRLKNYTWQPGWGAGEVPLRVGGRTYLVTRPLFSEMPVGVVYRYDENRLRRVAAFGLADAFDPLKEPKLYAALGSPDLTRHCFTWSDLNGDGEPQPAEAKLFPRAAHIHGVSNFNRDLSAQQQSNRYVVKDIRPDGVPVYEVETRAELSWRTLYRWDGGDFFRLGSGDREPEATVSREGRVRWTYPGEGAGVQALNAARPWSSGQVVSQFGVVGHETAHAGDLGEFLVVHGNTGAWNVWTADGMLVGPIFQDLRAGARNWSMPEHERGLMLDNITAGQEHFAGSFCRTADNRYYVVAGHNHVSLLEVLGIDQVRRSQGAIEVTAADLARARAWEQQQQRQEVYVRAPVVDCYRLNGALEIDGDPKDWRTPLVELSGGVAGRARFGMAYDEAQLYLLYDVQGFGPLRNTGRDWQRYFKTGGSADLQLGLDPAADPDRAAAAAGDVRLLWTYVDERPQAVLYQYVAPGAKPEEAFRVVSPVGEVTVDRVTRLTSARLARKGDDQSYRLEIALPLAALGLKPEPGLRLKLDWGVLSTGPEGTETLRRVYWANQATHTVADAPSEVRLQPQLWGHVRFHGPPPTAETALETLTNDSRDPRLKKDVDDLLDDIKDKRKK